MEIKQEFYCNICGRKLDDWDMQNGFSIHKKMGYGSKYDGEQLDMHVCCECMDKLIDDCKINPIGGER